MVTICLYVPEFDQNPSISDTRFKNKRDPEDCVPTRVDLLKSTIGKTFKLDSDFQIFIQSIIYLT